MNRFRLTLVACIAQTLALLLLTGCGAGTIADPTAQALGAPGVMTGSLHGGLNPVVGATVTLYVTANNGYGGAAVSWATATTGSNGGFSFTLPSNFSCPAGQFAYVTSYSGDTGSNVTFNTNSLLMVPIGACATNYSGLTYTGPFLWMNELTTIASAYALGNFMTIDTSGSAPVVNISVPANNNSLTPCIANGSTCTTTAAAGLPHAFANALALVNISSGQAVVSNGHGGVQPAGEIDLLGNILQACVNSIGSTGTNSATANDGTSCGKIFSMTTPPYSGAATPKNTLQAMINLAKYPNPLVNTWASGCTAAGSGAITATACLFGIASGTSAYPSVLTTTAPPDWALAVVYPKGTGVVTGSACTGTCAGLSYPYGLALDISDNVYVTNNNTSAQTWENIVALAFDGTPLWTTAEDTVINLVKNIATDGLGHVIIANNGNNTTPGSSGQFIKVINSSNGALLTTLTAGNGFPYCVAVDPYNNIWYGIAFGGTTNIYETKYTGTTAGVPQYSPVTFTSPPQAAQTLYQLTIDQGLNVWVTGNAATNTSAYLFPNTGSVATPAYAGTLKSAATTGSTSSGGAVALGLAPDGQGNAWMMTFSGLTQITSTGTGNSTTIAAQTPKTVADAGSRFIQVDSAHTVFAGDYANAAAVGGAVAYDTTHGLSLGLYKGCLINGNVCGTTSTTAAVYGARGIAIDSAGDIWMGSSVTGALTEFIGTAAPTWPALSLATFTAPQ